MKFTGQELFWTIAYRNPRANSIHRVADWSGTWEQAYDLAGAVKAANPELQVWYTTNRASEIAGHTSMDDTGNILMEGQTVRGEYRQGRRVPLHDNGSIATLLEVRPAGDIRTHRWHQDKRINDSGPDAIACNCTQSDGKDHVFTPSCMWDDNPAVSISAGDYGQPVGPKCTRHTNPAARPVDSHDVPGSGYVYPKTGPTCVKVWVSPNGVRHGIDEQGRCMTCGYSHDGQETITPEASAALIDDGHQGSSGTSVRELAHSWSMQVHELRAFADDLLDGLGDGDDIPTDTLATLTEARNTTPAPRFSGYAKRPLHTRISSTYYGQTRSRVHARFEAATDAEDLMCGATGLPTDDVETTTDAVDCPLCLRLLESRETYATELGI